MSSHPEYGKTPGFLWGPALLQSGFFLSIEHSARMTQAKTRRQLSGQFWRDYLDSVSNVGGWDDGDGIFTNYFAHPMQGAIAGYIQIQNDPQGVAQEFNGGPAYWRSRLKALGWSALYSTQFEIGPISEATLGNVGLRKGTSGYVDLMMTPLPGTALIVTEDALDRHLVRKWESRTSSLSKRRFYRVLLNPQRSFANVLRLKYPWHRDTRPLRTP